ncbi:hypothetical protein EJB05_23216, partial [Eragrostis curvula]
RWHSCVAAGFFSSLAAAAAALLGAVASARPWRPRRWLVRWPPSAWNDANARLHVLHTNSPSTARRGCFLARSGASERERVTTTSPPSLGRRSMNEIKRRPPAGELKKIDQRRNRGSMYGTMEAGSRIKLGADELLLLG